VAIGLAQHIIKIKFIKKEENIERFRIAKNQIGI
jgi:hypothetical protein